MLVKEKKINYLININNVKDIEDYKKVGITTFCFALKNYCIGYENTFSIEEINNINEDKYVIINKVLDTKEIEELKSVINTIKAKGFIFEDIGLINNIDETYEKILYMNHFNCNSVSANVWLNYVDSVVLSNELTFDEYKTITSKINKDIVLNVFGYNQVMYSKRKLLSNYNDNFNQEHTYKNEIKDKYGNVKFNIIEQDYNTIILSEKIFDGRRLLELDNVKYFYINSSFINKEDILKFIEGESVENTDEGFLDKPSFYKVKGGNV